MLPHRARVGLLAAACLLGALLVGTTVWTAVGIRQRTHELAMAEAHVLGRAMHDYAGDAPPDEAALEAFVAAHAEDGVRWAALVGPEGALLASAGTPSGSADDLPRTPRSVVHVGDALRVRLPPPPRPPGRGPPSGGPGAPPDLSPGALPPDAPPPGAPPPGAPPPDAPRDPPPGASPPHAPHPARPPDPSPDAPPSDARGGPPELVIEFVPTVALDLATRSRRAVFLAIAGAIVLVAASIVFVRSWARAEAAEQDLARTRHLASLGQMSAILAHEIRNPLAALKGHAQLLAELLPAGADRARADRVVHEALRLETLTTSLLDFARTARVERVPADPVAVLREAASGFDGVRVSGTAPTWSLDPGKVRQVLENLVRNATQADPGGAIEASVAVEGRDLVYTVRDRGPGIPQEAQERVFESFETGRTDGVGLGLPIARRIVTLHGGTVVAGNHPDGGALLTVRIPEA